MLMSLVSPAEFVRAFHQDSDNEDLLCIYVGARDSREVAGLLGERADVDATLGNRIAFIVFGPNLVREVTVLSAVPGKAFSVPAISVKALTGFVRRSGERPSGIPVDIFLQQLADDHINYVEELCDYFQIESQLLPMMVLIVRGQLAPPSLVRVPPKLRSKDLIEWLKKLAICVERTESRDLGDRWDFLDRANKVLERRDQIVDEVALVREQIQKAFVWLREQPVDLALLDQFRGMIATLTFPPQDFLQRLILDSRKHAPLSNAFGVIKRRVGRIRVLEEELEQLRSGEEQQQRRLHEILVDDERLRQQFVRDVQAETGSVTKGWSLGLGVVVPAALTSLVPVVGKAIGPLTLSFLKVLRNG